MMEDVNRPSAVMILAAGQGTRMKSRTPKVLHTLCGRTLLAHAIHTAADAGAPYIVPIVRHERERVATEALSAVPDATVILADQDEIPGTGRAVQCGLEVLLSEVPTIGGSVVVTSADVPLLDAETVRELVRLHEDGDHAVTVVTTIVDDPTGYGRVVRDEDGSVRAIVEQRDATDEQREICEINAGIYAFDVEFLHRALMSLTTDNDQGELYLTDTIARAGDEGRRCAALVLDDAWQAQGCNDRAQLADLRREMNRRILARHMAAGVGITDPNTTWIDVDVTIGMDATIEPGTILAGRTHVGEDAMIGPHTTLRDVEVGRGARVAHVLLEDVNVDADADIRPR